MSRYNSIRQRICELITSYIMLWCKMRVLLIVFKMPWQRLSNRQEINSLLSKHHCQNSDLKIVELFSYGFSEVSEVSWTLWFISKCMRETRKIEKLSGALWNNYLKYRVIEQSTIFVRQPWIPFIFELSWDFNRHHIIAIDLSLWILVSLGCQCDSSLFGWYIELSVYFQEW